MRKVKHDIAYRVPSWALCNLDTVADKPIQTKTCRFCVKTKEGHRCVLHDTLLTTEGTLVNKAYECKRATAGYAITVDEPIPTGPRIDPKLIITETLKEYKKTYNDLLSQGYPKAMAESIATKYMLGE